MRYPKEWMRFIHSVGKLAMNLPTMFIIALSCAQELPLCSPKKGYAVVTITISSPFSKRLADRSAPDKIEIVFAYGG